MIHSMTDGIVQKTARVTAATIAAYTGLSRATVTHVLNGRGAEQRIRQDTQERVLEAARVLGYRPNASARALHTGRTGNVALIQSLKGAYLPERLLLGLTEALGENNMYLTLAEVPDAVLDDRAYLPKVLREHTADGLIINRIVGIPPSFTEAVTTLNTPVIFLNVNRPFDTVFPDDFNGGKLAAQYLVELGHKHILYVGSSASVEYHYSHVDRQEGYRAAMEEAGLPSTVFLLPPHPETDEQVLKDARVQIVRSYLEAAAPRPTAIVAYELAEAMAVLHAVNQMQIRLPQDLSLVMFHHQLDHRFCIPITTLCNGMHSVGREAVNLLLDKIGSPGTSFPSRVVPIQLLEGATSGPVPNLVR